MKGVILQGEKIYYNNLEIFYTDLSIIIQACQINVCRYNWLLTQYECNYYPNEELKNKRHDYMWLTGNEFSELIQNSMLQFIWGIIIAFPITVSLEEVLKIQLPTYQAEEYFHPLSTLEIISEDSSLVKVFSKQKSNIQHLMNNIPEVRKI